MYTHANIHKIQKHILSYTNTQFIYIHINLYTYTYMHTRIHIHTPIGMCTQWVLRNLLMLIYMYSVWAYLMVTTNTV